MNFKQALNDFFSDLHIRNIQQKTKRGINKYYQSPSLKLSRIYGYNDECKIIPKEAAIIRKVFFLFSAGHSPLEVKSALDKEDDRTRLGNRFTTKQLTGLIRSIYAGLIKKPNGGYVRSKNYEAIVSPEIYKKALKNLQKLPENRLFLTPYFHLDDSQLNEQALGGIKSSTIRF
jgi:hypothetical protein